MPFTKVCMSARRPRRLHPHVAMENPEDRTWTMNGKRTVEKIRNPSQWTYLRFAELFDKAKVKCNVCQTPVDCNDVPILWPKLPIGVKFDPTDLELLQNLEEKCNLTNVVPYVLENQFIPTIEQPEGICYTHPENLPGIKTDGSSRHFFHRLSNAYGCGHRKRRKIDNNKRTASEVRWHKTGRSKVVYDENGAKRGWKKILVLYAGSKKGGSKTDKAGWVMHQYHLGADEAEKDGQLVVSKIFYQAASKQIDKPEMGVSVAEHDASAVKIDRRTAKGEAGSSKSKFRTRDSGVQAVGESSTQRMEVTENCLQMPDGLPNDNTATCIGAPKDSTLAGLGSESPDSEVAALLENFLT